jgi:transposase
MGSWGNDGGSTRPSCGFVRCGWSRSRGLVTSRSGAAINSVAAKLGIGTAETLRKWVRQGEVDAGRRAGTSTEEAAEVRRLKREVAELRRANEILKAAAGFFAAELDRPHRIS